MTAADVAEYIGYLFLAYASGWGSGFLFYGFKRALDYL